MKASEREERKRERKRERNAYVAFLLA